jgi:hypothetical protein
MEVTVASTSIMLIILGVSLSAWLPTRTCSKKPIHNSIDSWKSRISLIDVLEYGEVKICD